MIIEPHTFTIREIQDGYEDRGDDGVSSMNGHLNIRPAYQREFVYKDAKRNKVIDTIQKGYPLNVMYWMDLGDGYYEILDGQQRTISFCSFTHGKFSINERNFTNYTQPEKDRILDYEVLVYICKGNEEERLNWFQTINIAGEPLTEQEMRNAIFLGPWVQDAKRYFSRVNAPACAFASDYLSGNYRRQEYLETAIEWIASIEGKSVKQYMSDHQHDPDASDLWLYFKTVIEWAKTKFPFYDRTMKGVEWGLLYNDHKDDRLDPKELAEKVKRLLKDDEVQKKSGIYAYVLDGDERHLNLRAFTDSDKETMYARQDGVCPMCKREGRTKFRYAIQEMEADHIKPWHEGGRTVIENCQMLCKEHNRIKGGK